ncbi:alkylation response protein AidB-like acyl-CoA dehydrogenase [Paenibacillus shirakamiensis]|uniref:Alkylation response protein AidB-like acyl-CoA dehydrogenase n=1 Tax=Paenibacillus shirakamiensis TaxID=1265935 RepID=A0ABS4JKJ4_9BACL|nr:acyl-CoA dehydrogenase family protein [Paenibacillus shirakamiensis]MBP2002234.1 alkylation response protein AidB-like acyl-CoA dehydrogenase [Paenibacillus shirakamiensis]
MLDLFIRTEVQREWVERLKEKKSSFMERGVEIDLLGTFPGDNIQELIEMGYTRSTLPVDRGGYGLRVVDMVLLQETLASYDASTALSIGWHLSVVGELFEKQLWTSDKMTCIAEEIAKGALLNRAASEAQTGSPTRGGRPGTVAVREGKNWIITGRKVYTTLSPVLTYFLVSAWIEETQSVGQFLLHKDVAGLRIEETWDTMSLRGTGSHDLILDRVRVSEDQLVEPGRRTTSGGAKPLNGWLLHIPACYLGIAQAARDYAVQFSTEYCPNSLNGPISQLPNVQHLLGQIDLELMNIRHFLYSVAEAYDDPSRRQLLKNELGAAKHAVTNGAISIVDQAMRVVGIRSLQRDNPLQRYYRDVRAGLHNPPMDDAVIHGIALSAIEGAKG